MGQETGVGHIRLGGRIKTNPPQLGAAVLEPGWGGGKGLILIRECGQTGTRGPAVANHPLLGGLCLGPQGGVHGTKGAQGGQMYSYR